MTPDELRAARALIKMDLDYLARAVDIEPQKLLAIEQGGFIEPEIHARVVSLFADKGVSFGSVGTGFHTFSFMQGVSRPIMMSRPNHKGTQKPG